MNGCHTSDEDADAAADHAGVAAAILLMLWNKSGTKAPDRATQDMIDELRPALAQAVSGFSFGVTDGEKKEDIIEAKVDEEKSSYKKS